MRQASFACDTSVLPPPPAISWEETGCLLCGKDDWIPQFEAADPAVERSGLRFLIVRCIHCGLCFTNPRPDPASISRFYPADYRCHRRERTSSRQGSRGHALASLVCRQAPRTSRSQSRLLDLGCGAGEFLQCMHQLGWNAIGLDTAEAAIETALQHGLPARFGTLPQPGWGSASFDVITMWQSLEHVHDPLAALRDAHRLLDAQGRLLVSVPNLESLSSRWFGSNWYGLDVPRHLTHFTSETLRGMLQRAGFAETSILQEQHASWIRHSARLDERRQGGDLLTRCMRTRFGSGIAGRWGRWSGQAESLLAIAVK
jgi:SAM-dependent methyltransferase